MFWQAAGDGLGRLEADRQQDKVAPITAAAGIQCQGKANTNTTIQIPI